MNRRGLTLLEVLAAAALLAVMAGACVPLLRDAARLTQPQSRLQQPASQQSASQLESNIVEDTDLLAAALKELSELEHIAMGEGVLLLDELPGEALAVSLLQQSASGSWLMYTWRSGKVLIWQPAVDSEDEP